MPIVMLIAGLMIIPGAATGAFNTHIAEETQARCDKVVIAQSQNSDFPVPSECRPVADVPTPQ